MADPRRQSVAGKVATPKVAPTSAQQAGGDAETLSKAIGARIRVTTTLQSHTVEGTIFAADPLTNLLAVSSPSGPGPNPPSDYHIIPVSSIQSFQLLSPAGEAADAALPSITKLDVAALRAREEAALKEAREKEANRGKGVSREGQEVFDHFRRTLPTRWHGTTIVVNEAVLVEPPYRTEDIKAPRDKQAQLPQIKRVLEGYYSRRKQQDAAAQGNGRVPAVTPIPPRKGG